MKYWLKNGFAFNGQHKLEKFYGQVVRKLFKFEISTTQVRSSLFLPPILWF